MPVHVFFRSDRCLRLKNFFEVGTPRHFEAFADFYALRGELLAHDLISLVDEEVVVSGFTPDALGQLRQRYRTLQLAADFVVQRRSAWVCPSVAAWPILEAWLQGRHAHDGQGT